MKAGEKKPFSLLPKWTTSEQHGVCRSDDFWDSELSVFLVLFCACNTETSWCRVCNNFYFVAENRPLQVNALEKLQFPLYLASPEEHEKSNEMARFPARLGNMGICAAIIDFQGLVVPTEFHSRRLREFRRRKSFLSWSSQLR